MRGRCNGPATWRHLKARNGSVSILAAFSIMMLVYSAAVAIDLTSLYWTKALNQRIADQSAIAAAFAYEQSGRLTTAQNAASSLALSNGSGAATVLTSIVASPSNDGRLAAMVVVQSASLISGFGQMATATVKTPFGTKSIAISATAYAEIHEAPPCIIALQSAGVAATGGTNTTANRCTIGSTGSVTATSGARITAQAIEAVGTISASNGASITTSPTAGRLFPGSSSQQDPFANAGVFGRLPTVAALSAPMFPSVGSAPPPGSSSQCSGTMTIGPGYYGTISTTSYPSCSTITFSGGSETDIGGSGLQIGGGSVTINFGAGTYRINGLTMSNYGTATINLTGSPTLYIWGGIKQTGSASLLFNGTASYYVQGGITNTSSSTLSFSNSGTAVSSFYVANGIAISNGSASFPNGYFTITSGDGAAGIDLSGGTTASFGNGSFNIANGITIGGGARLTIGSALFSSSLFQVDGTDAAGSAIATGGGSTLSIGGFTNFDINGAMSIQGSVALGSGNYTVNGAVNLSASGGGTLTGTNVSVVASGPISFGAGFSQVSLTSPQTIESAGESMSSTIALASQSSSASRVTAGASNTEVIGAVYFPNAPLTLDGAGNLNGNGDCLQIVAGSISLSGGSSLSTNCPTLGNSGTLGAVTLVQ